MYDERADGIRSYDLAIKEARRKLLEPTEAKLWAAIKILRECGVSVLHSEGEGICALWNVGDLRKVGYYEVIRRAKSVKSKTFSRAQVGS